MSVVCVVCVVCVVKLNVGSNVVLFCFNNLFHVQYFIISRSIESLCINSLFQVTSSLKMYLFNGYKFIFMKPVCVCVCV